jgi:hypothetical protein
MNSTKIISAFVGLALMSLGQLAAVAQEKPEAEAQTGSFYVDFGSSLIKIQDLEGAAAALTVRGGVEFTPNLAAEAELGVGLTEQDGLNVDYYGAGFLVVKAPVADNAEVFARVGYATTEVTYDGGFFIASGSTDGAAVGVGARWSFVRLDYTYIDTPTGGNVFGISFGTQF